MARENPPHLKFERAAYQAGARLVAGLDEVGRGAWAGPLVAAIVVNQPSRISKAFLRSAQISKAFLRSAQINLQGSRIRGVRDSKLLSPKRRADLAVKIKKSAVGWGIGEVSNREIDQWGLTKAQFIAYERAILKLRRIPDLILIDGRTYRAFPHTAAKIEIRYIPKGDRICYSIACASIIAKDYRDRLMKRYKSAIKYGFDRHVGYGTLRHRQMIERHGLSRLHRKTFLNGIYLSNRAVASA